MRYSRILIALAIWSVFGVVCLIAGYAHAGEASASHQFVPDPKVMGRDVTAARPIPPGLQRIMSEGAGRAVNPTCDDVRAVVAWIGEARAMEMARGAGASSSQIDKARRCLK